MLKVTYLESGLYLEQLSETIEAWISLRVILALRMSQRLVVEHSTASLLLPLDLVQRSSLITVAEEMLPLTQVDAEYIEVSLSGTWISSDQQEAEGVFVTALHPAIEPVLFALWQAQGNPSSIRR
jgi:hypothetical protein